MTASNPQGGAPLPSFTDADLIENIHAVFSDKLTSDNALHRGDLFRAFANLTGIYVAQNCPLLITQIKYDYAAVQAMFARFQRDAFGVGHYHDFVKQLQTDGQITPEGALEVLRNLSKLGIRINTESPRKTKIAAAFSLWMSVFRPVHLKDIVQPGITREQHDTFCASLNFWMASMYLALFGSVFMNDDEDGKVRTTRIKHDLTYRALNLSSLEMLYMSIYRNRV